MANFLRKAANGIIQAVEAITASAGATDADKLIATDANGLIDTSLLPSGVGNNTKTANAGVNLTAGDLVYIDASGDVQLADNTSIATAATGFVLDTVTATNPVTVFLSGVNNSVTATSGTTYFLDTAGGLTATAPAFAVGTICQNLGVACGANELLFEYNQPVEFANQ